MDGGGWKETVYGGLGSFWDVGGVKKGGLVVEYGRIWMLRDWVGEDLWRKKNESCGSFEV